MILFFMVCCTLTWDVKGLSSEPVRKTCLAEARVAIVMLLSTGAAATLAAERPNVIYILADDLGRNDCGFMGGTEIKTPHIDRLARRGVILDAFYVQPVCSPTRAALLTGRYPMRHGPATIPGDALPFAACVRTSIDARNHVPPSIQKRRVPGEAYFALVTEQVQ